MNTAPLIQPENTYWHFLPKSRLLQHGDGRWVVADKTLRVEGLPVLNERGLHASARAIDALGYASGSVVCLVTLGGKVIHGKGKSVAQERTCLWMADATEILWEFACDVAETALLNEREAGREPDPRSWAGVAVARRFLRGEASEAERFAASHAANAATLAAYAADRAAFVASDAAYAAACAAKSAAKSPWAIRAADKAVTAASDAAYRSYATGNMSLSCASDAKRAADIASYIAYHAADTPATTAAAHAVGSVTTWSTTYAAFSVRLTQMLLAAGQVQTDLKQARQKEEDLWLYLARTR